MSNEHDSTAKEKSLTIIKRMGSVSLGSKPCLYCKKIPSNHCCLAEVINSNIVVEWKKACMFVVEMSTLSAETIGVMRKTLPMF